MNGVLNLKRKLLIAKTIIFNNLLANLSFVNAFDFMIIVEFLQKYLCIDAIFLGQMLMMLWYL